MPLKYFNPLRIGKGGFIMESNSNRLLSVKEVVRETGLSSKMVYRLVGQPGFPSIKIGGKYVVPQDELRLWIKRYTGKSFELV